MMVYAVHMFRYGNEESHSYINCICATEEVALLMGDLEKSNRAGKYEPKIVCMELLDKPISKCVECNKLYEEELTGWFCQECRNGNETRDMELAEMKSCTLSQDEILKDLQYVVDLTGSETPSEIEHLHQTIYHSETKEFYDNVYDDVPTQKQMALKARDERQAWQRCAICPPNRGENSSRKPTHGAQKKAKPNKKQGAEMKRINYSEAELMSGYVDKTKKAGKRK